MGINISIHAYPVKSLLNDIENYVSGNGGYRDGALPAREWFLKVSPEFGVVSDGKFYVLWNEYYEDYNPGSQFLSAVDDYYFPNRKDEDAQDGYWDTFWSYEYTTAPGGVNAAEILGELFPEEFGYEGKFSNE